MFTQLIRKGKWSYMFLAVLATLAVATMATLVNTRTAGGKDGKNGHESEQVITGRHTQYNQTTMRFIN